MDRDEQNKKEKGFDSNGFFAKNVHYVSRMLWNAARSSDELVFSPYISLYYLPGIRIFRVSLHSRGH
jgi:hypothetical protein